MQDGSKIGLTTPVGLKICSADNQSRVEGKYEMRATRDCET